MATDEKSLYSDLTVSSLIVDPGSLTIRMGVSGTVAPSVVESSFVGVRAAKSSKRVKTERAQQYLFDPLSSSCSRGCEVVATVREGVIANMGSFKATVARSLPSLVTSEKVRETPVVVSEAVTNPPRTRAECSEWVFEELGAPAFYLAKTAVLSSFSVGKPTSLVFDCGHDVSTATPVCGGFALYRPSRRSNVAGRYVTESLASLFPLKPGKLSVPGSYREHARLRFFNDIKEDPECYAEGEDDDSKSYTFNALTGEEATIEVPKKTVVDSFGQLFANFARSEEDNFEGVQKMVVDSIDASDVDLRKELFGNVVVVGGTTRVPSFSAKMEEELENAVSGRSSLVRINSMFPEVDDKIAHGSWVGASILASLGTFQSMWIAKKEYAELGAETAIRKKCY